MPRLFSSIKPQPTENRLTKEARVLTVVSAIVVILAYPTTEFWFLSWVGLIPLLFALDGKTWRQALGIGYLWGILFFGGNLYWFIHIAKSAGIPLFLALLATVSMNAYLALYPALFAVGYRLFARNTPIEKMFVLPSLWVALEFMRDRLFSGFGWVSLGHSQYKVLPVIQIADITGVFGVSFLIVMVNVVFKNLIETLSGHKQELKSLFATSFLTLGLLAGVLGYGLFCMNYLTNDNKASARVAVIQANVPQDLKWIPKAWPAIMISHQKLTEQAAATSPDIIIWPETSFPGYLWDAPELFEKLKGFVRENKIPLLLGAVTKEGERYYNSALLLDRDGRLIVKHHKLHLVPFGEFIPLRHVFPIISSLIPIADFSSGKTLTQFPLAISPRTEIPFSVLICFEDTVAPVARSLVKAGAQLLVNITNDAWFADSKAPFLHLQAAVFRAVENRRSLVRAANTGVSSFISPWGEIGSSVENERHKKTFVDGYASERVFLSRDGTFYTKFGDVFAYLSFVCILWGAMRGKVKKIPGQEWGALPGF